jgi:NAD(P)-dependent dehydrogenase (short-subunit alcohol dehydrogenase family)
MSLEGQRILVVGGSAGIGFAVARAAAHEGARLTLASSDRARVEEAVVRLGGETQGLTLDVRDGESVRAALAGAGPIDHLVFTAGDWGGPRRSALKDVDLETARGLFAVRFWGALTVAQAALGQIREAGSIIFTDGMIAHRPRPGSAISSAMAGAVEHAVRGLAVELAPIRVNGVSPGMVRTGVWDAIPEAAREAQFREFTARQPLPRVGEPDEVAQAYLYLMKATYTTGQVLQVDGGMGIV